MPASDEPAPANPVFTVFMIVALLAVWGFVQDAINTSKGGSIDLRNRITGVRLAAEQRDPYFYKWKRTEDDRFCDLFNSPASPVSHTTVTPVTLTAFLPLKNLPYPVSQWIWFAVQYACLGLGFYAWCRSTPRQHWLWGGLLTCLFCLSPHWRLHVDRGQSYVLYAGLFLTHIGWGQRTGKAGPWLEGLSASLLTVLRPTYGLLLGIGVARRKAVAMVATTLGLLLWAVLPVLLAGIAIWQNYFKAMGEHARLYLTQTKFPPAKFSGNETIEGMPIETLGGFARIPFGDTSIYKLISFQLHPSVLLGTWGVLAALSGFLMMRRGETGTPRFWWAVSAWIVIGDYLLPAYRYPYNHILLWPLVLLGLAALSGSARAVWISLSTALLVLHGAAWFLPISTISWPGVGMLLLALGVAARTYLPAKREAAIS